jgi:DNA-directed RNA polymerase omega subunit
MEYVVTNQLLDRSCNSVYKLVILASKRALEISEGQPKLVEMDSSVKPSSVALQEITEGKVYSKKLKSKEQ